MKAITVRKLKIKSVWESLIFVCAKNKETELFFTENPIEQPLNKLKQLFKKKPDTNKAKPLF